MKQSLQIVELKQKAKGEKITTLDELTVIKTSQGSLSGFELSLDLDGNPAVWLLVGLSGKNHNDRKASS